MPLKTLLAFCRIFYRLCRRRRFLPRLPPPGGVLPFSRRRRLHLAPFSVVAASLCACMRAPVVPLCRLAACNALIFNDCRAVDNFIDLDHKTQFCPLCRRLVTCCAPSVRATCYAVPPCCILIGYTRAFGGGSPPRSQSCRHGGGCSPLRAFGDGERTAPRLRVAPFIARGMGACPLSAFARVFTGQYLVP